MASSESSRPRISSPPRRHQRVVVGWLDERQVSANIAAHIGRGSFCSAFDERGKVLVGDVWVRHVFLYRRVRRPYPNLSYPRRFRTAGSTCSGLVSGAVTQ